MAALVNRRRCYTGNSGGIDYSKMYFTIESFDADNTISIENYKSGNPVFDYSLDNGSTWNSITVEENTTQNIATIDTGEKILLRGVHDQLPGGDGYYNRIKGSEKFKVYGNAMSLLWGDDFINNPFFKNNIIRNLANLFLDSTNLLDAENLILPAITLNKSCYLKMFSGCTSLTKTPKLSATVLADGCYKEMFKGCTSLVVAPNLPAETLAPSCYRGMFSDCINLINTPVLPATILETTCYNSMFQNCTSLTTAPELPVTTLKNDCYSLMFCGCTNLTKAPNLLSTELTYHCYYQMFSGCSSLKEITCIATDISAEYCLYQWMDGVSSTGKFHKALSMTDWVIGSGGIPTGWTVDDADVLPTTIEITGPDSIAKEAVYTINYTPYYTIYTGVTWSVVSGDATINQNGVLTPGSTFGNITIQAVSTYNPSVVATKTVEYADGKVLNSITIVGKDTIHQSTANAYTIEYNPSYTFYTGVTWSVVSGSATITQDGVLTPTAIGNVVIQAISTHDSTIVSTKTINVEERPYSLQYFTIESLENSNTISIKNENSSIEKPTFYYSLDNGNTWSSVTMATNSTRNIATINSGDKVIFKSINSRLASEWNAYNRFNGSKNFKVYGNIMSLLYGDDFVNNPEFASGSTNNFVGLFKSTKTVIDASNLILPSTTVYQNSYNGMFRDCTNLVYAPELPATNLNGKGCYSSMFEGCISLVEAPELPATTLWEECYSRMFCMSRTTKLTTPAMTKSPLLPAATLVTNAYKEMFKGNGNLVEITCLATNVSSNTSDWVANVSSTGTFKKNANMSSWTTGTSGIPSGWTVVDYVAE